MSVDSIRTAFYAAEKLEAALPRDWARESLVEIRGEVDRDGMPMVVVRSGESDLSRVLPSVPSSVDILDRSGKIEIVKVVVRAMPR